VPAAATGEDTEKTDGIPNYMLRTSGTIARLAEGEEVTYEPGSVVSIVTSDMIDMVQQQGGAAEKVNTLGENILVEGLLFDDFKVNSTFEIASPDDDAGVVTLEVFDPRRPPALELGQLGDDDAKRQSVVGILSIQAGFCGWMARIADAGQVKSGSNIAKLTDEQADAIVADAS